MICNQFAQGKTCVDGAHSFPSVIDVPEPGSGLFSIRCFSSVVWMWSLPMHSTVPAGLMLTCERV